MARHWFGQGPADWTFIPGTGNVAVLTAGVEVTMHSAQTGGVPYEDLLDSAGNPITEVISGDGISMPVGTIPRFQGPDGITSMWADADGGIRYLLMANDLGEAIEGKLDLAGGSMSGELRLADDSPAASEDFVDDAITTAGIAGAPLILPFNYDGIISVRTGADRIYNDTGRPLDIGTVRAAAAVAPAGQALVIDVHKNGTTIYTTQANRPSIADGQLTGTGGTPDLPVWAEGEYLTVDVDQVGTTTPGSGLTVTIVAN